MEEAVSSAAAGPDGSAEGTRREVDDEADAGSRGDKTAPAEADTKGDETEGRGRGADATVDDELSSLRGDESQVEADEQHSTKITGVRSGCSGTSQL